MNATREVNRLLEEHGAVLIRHNKHLVYRLPNGNTFTGPLIPEHALMIPVPESFATGERVAKLEGTIDNGPLLRVRYWPTGNRSFKSEEAWRGLDPSHHGRARLVDDRGGVSTCRNDRARSRRAASCASVRDRTSTRIAAAT